MSVNAMPGFSGTGLVPLTPVSSTPPAFTTPAVFITPRVSTTPPVSTTPTVAAPQTSADTGLAAIKPAPPVLRVPTDPLTPAVLAQLIGRELSL